MTDDTPPPAFLPTDVVPIPFTTLMVNTGSKLIALDTGTGAALGAMAMAVANLFPPPDRLLVDGPFPLPLPIPQEPIPGGDGRSLSIAAASIIAKVTRDRLMALCDTHFPGWDFARHKGYPTAEHRAAIRLHGCSPIHRRSFRGVREALDRVEEAVHGGPPPGAC